MVDEKTDDMTPESTVRVLASIAQARSEFASQAGITYAGKRDLFTVLGYKKKLTITDYRERYERGEVAARAVDALPRGTWRGGGTLIEDEDPNVITPFEKAWEEFNKKHMVWSVFCAADILARIGRYSVILLGAPGALDSPLPKKLGPTGIKYLAPYSEEDVTIEDVDLETNMASERFGLPNFYTLRRVTNGVQKLTQRRVHYTRIIHVNDTLLDERLYSAPALKRIWNRLDDLDKIAGGGSEAYYVRSNPGYMVSIDPQVKMETTDVDKLKEAVEEFVHGQRRTIAQRGASMESLAQETSDFHFNVESILTLISAGTGIPVRILTGSERGELASSQDKTNWDERVSDRRSEMAAPLVKRFVDRLVEHGALPAPKGEFESWWPDPDELNEEQKAKVVKLLSSCVTASGEEVFAADELRDMYYDLEPLERLDEDRLDPTDELLDPTKEDEEDVDEEKPVAKAAVRFTDRTSIRVSTMKKVRLACQRRSLRRRTRRTNAGF